MDLRKEFERLKDEHEAEEYKVDLYGMEDTLEYLRRMKPLELFMKEHGDEAEKAELWNFQGYYIEKNRFKFQYTKTNICVAQHFRYDRHRVHSHDFFQINYCVEGEWEVIIENTNQKKSAQNEVITMRAGDFTLIAPDTGHSVRAFSDDCVIIKYYIRRSTFERTFFEWLGEDDMLSAFFRNAIQGGENACLSFHTGGDTEVKRLALTIYAELMSHRQYFRIISESRLTEMFCLLVRNHIGSAETISDRRRTEGSVARIFAYLRENYADADLDGAAKYAGYSKNYLCRLIQRATGRTFTSLLNEVRVDSAKKMLLAGRGSVSEIGRSVGFGSDEHFHRVFREYAGMSPLAWRAESVGK